jgi:hypothetical protein
VTPDGVDRLFERLGALFWKVVLFFVIVWTIFGIAALIQKVI